MGGSPSPSAGQTPPETSTPPDFDGCRGRGSGLRGRLNAGGGGVSEGALEWGRAGNTSLAPPLPHGVSLAGKHHSYYIDPVVLGAGSVLGSSDPRLGGSGGNSEDGKLAPSDSWVRTEPGMGTSLTQLSASDLPAPMLNCRLATSSTPRLPHLSIGEESLTLRTVMITIRHLASKRLLFILLSSWRQNQNA